jgi:cytoskeletal protein CcmA (bactofilin family)
MQKFIVTGAALIFLMIPAMTFSAEFRLGEQPSIGSSEKIADDLYLTGGNVTSAGEISGDLTALGGTLIISGNVKGDLMAGGGNITILSNVEDDVRAGGGTVVIQGKIDGDLIAGGGQVTIGGPGIGGDAVLGGGNIRIESPVLGELRIGGGNVYINAPIGGDVKIDAEKVTLGKNAVITGDINYKAKKEMVLEEGAVVKGKIDFEMRKGGREHSRAAFGALFPALVFWKFLALLLGALIFGLVFRRYSMEIAGMAAGRPFFQLGLGIIVFVAMPLLSLLFLVSVVGIPLGVIGLLGFVILVLFSWMMAPIIVGSVAYRYFSKKGLEVSWKTILIGVLICSILGIVPFLGALVQALLMFLSLGCIFSLKKQIVREWR